MKRYRLNAVSFLPSESLPILVACPKDKADGLVVTEARNRRGGRPVHLRFVRVVNDDAIKSFVTDGDAFQKEYGAVPKDAASRLLGLLQLTEALKSGNQSDWNWACDLLTSTPNAFGKDFSIRILRFQPGVELARHLAEGLTDVELVLWWKEVRDDQVIELGLRCPDPCSALFAQAAISVVAGGTGIGACLKCGKAFWRRRRTRKFCSDTCRYDMHMKRLDDEPQKSNKRRKRL